MSFGLETDPALGRIAAIVHYLDIGGFPVPESAAVEAALRGMRAQTDGDDLLLERASQLFDDLYAGYTELDPREQQDAVDRLTHSRSSRESTDLQLESTMDRFQPSLSYVPFIFALLLTPGVGSVLAAEELDPALIGKASGAEASLTDDGVVRIGWSRTDVKVTVDGMPLPPAAGLGSWAAFTATENGAMVMGDTVVFQDEVDAAMDAAFAHGLGVTALHNHFFYDSPKVYFMHIGGAGDAQALASGVKAVWDAILAVREAEPQPASGFGGVTPVTGDLDADALSEIVGHTAAVNGGVAKITIARTGHAHGREIGGSMGLTTWAAFSGSDERAAIDGDFIMSGEEVQPVLRALRDGGLHVVALHNHMIGEQPGFYFTHYWGKGPAAELARAFRGALDAQAAASESHAAAP